MTEHYSEKYEMPYLNGFVALGILVVLALGLVALFLVGGAFVGILLCLLGDISSKYLFYVCSD